MVATTTQQNIPLDTDIDNATKDWQCANCGEPIQIPFDANGIEDAYYCDPCAASHAGTGEVSSAKVDKAAEKAKVPNITFNINVATNYEKLVTLASQQTDEDGNPYTVHRFAKESLFSALSLSMDGEILRRKTGQITDEVLAQTLLAQTVGLDVVKAMSASDRSKMEKILLNAIKPSSEQLALARAAVQGGLAAAAQREAAAKLAK